MWGGGEKQRKQQQWFMFHELCSVGGRGSLGDFWGLEKGYDTVPLLEPRPHCCWLEQHRDQLLYGQHITMVSLFHWQVSGTVLTLMQESRLAMHSRTTILEEKSGVVRWCEPVWGNVRWWEAIRVDLKQCEAVWSNVRWYGADTEQVELLWNSLMQCEPHVRSYAL